MLSSSAWRGLQIFIFNLPNMDPTQKHALECRRKLKKDTTVSANGSTRCLTSPALLRYRNSLPGILQAFFFLPPFIHRGCFPARVYLWFDLSLRSPMAGKRRGSCQVVAWLSQFPKHTYVTPSVFFLHGKLPLALRSSFSI